MIKHEYTSCATCHADPSGGELLTKYGRVTSDLILRMQYGERDESKTPPTGVLWGLWENPDSFLVSGSYRNLWVVRPDLPEAVKFVPVMQADLYGQLTLGSFIAGGSIGINRSAAGSSHGRGAQVTTSQDDSLNMISRTHYIGAKIGDSMWLRAGRLNLPFGVRQPEHTLWVREATRTDRESDQQHGVGFAYVGERVRMEVMAIAGNFQLGPDKYRERGYSFFIEGIADGNLAAGISSKVTYAAEDRYSGEIDTVRQAHGLMMRWAPIGSLAFLAEANALFRTNADAGYVGMVQADYEPVGGLHFLLTGEVLDQGLPISAPPLPATPGLGEPRFGFWGSIDWFFYTQLELRLDAIVRQDDPFTLLGQLHFYL